MVREDLGFPSRSWNTLTSEDGLYEPCLWLETTGFKYSMKEKNHPASLHQFLPVQKIVSLSEMLQRLKGGRALHPVPSPHLMLHLLVLCWAESFGWLFQVDVLTSEWHLWKVSKTPLIVFLKKSLLMCTHHSSCQTNFVLQFSKHQLCCLSSLNFPVSSLQSQKKNNEQEVERCCLGPRSRSYLSH